MNKLFFIANMLNCDSDHSRTVLIVVFQLISVKCINCQQNGQMIMSYTDTHTHIHTYMKRSWSCQETCGIFLVPCGSNVTTGYLKYYVEVLLNRLKHHGT